MSLTTSEMTPADIAAVTNNNGGGYGNGMFGDGAWWIIILFLFVFCGWGNNGFGNNGGGSGMQGALTRGDLCSEFSFNDVQNGIRNISDAVNTGFANLNSTICHQQYDTAMMINGVTAAVNGGFSALNSTICQQQYETAGQLNGISTTIMQGNNAIQAQLAQCCCDQRAGLADLKYTIASEDCATRQAIADSTRAILDRMTAQEMAAKDAQITALNQQLFRADLSASQAAQNSYLINTLRPTPVPAYPASSPCGLGNWAPQVLTGAYGYNNGCGGCCNG